MLIETDNLKYCNEAIELKQNIERDFLSLGEYLYNIKEHNLFEPQWSSFLEFCDELKMTPSNAYRLIKIFKVFVLDYNIEKKLISDASVSSLMEIVPIIQTKKEALGWLKKSTLLTRQDLRKELTEHKNGVDMIKCLHKNVYQIEICRDCGERHQIGIEL